MERAQRFLRVAVLKNAGQDISSRGQWRLDISANSVSHERCVLAVEHFSSYHIERGRPPEMAKKKEIPSAVEAFSWNEAASAVKGLVMGAGQVEIRSETLFGTLTSSSNDISHDVHVANGLPNRISGTRLGTFKGSYRKLLKETGLNTSQKAAVEAALCRKVTLWQGPPGTGKTKTLVQFVRIHCRSGQGKVLACADSNIAVDNLLEGLLSEGLVAVRIGQPVKVKEELRAVTLEARVSVHPLLKRAIEIKQMAKTRRQNKNKDTPGSLWEEATELEGRACREVISRADVVAATCIGAGDPVLDGLRFTACVIDEATQATEPATLIPLLKSGADCFVLVGDPAQLPPTVVSKEAVECGLEVSLFEHLQACGLSPMLLDTQYRMHPVLARFSSRNFYEGKLFSQPLPAERMAPKGYDWPNVEKPLAFVNCSNGKELMRHDSSWQNEVEALQVVKTVKDLVSGGDIEGGCAGIGIIAPYSAQVKLLQDLFLTQSEDFSKLEIKSVDGFQGREKEVIVFCTVRSNDHGALGFVANPRRMNVAITRARRGLVVVGNASTLESSCHWNLWLKEIREQGLFAPHSR
ncbi:regulator of nonsense transcripts 1-like [Selaginella moellendorffii]|uniref:regulator of nonsense transcripts 1-like n=1 Tax=Selaginella moellendorffii TaxID=88036 RepID=UPI000D1C3463|nr:regulator of nonsense transcripts 1-like [Selaginella moellendorffii]|eukprot:XP_024527418.1 regulator of nonsense transcripts 1-like [Selaginella moellendorffii]